VHNAQGIAAENRFSRLFCLMNIKLLAGRRQL
jgi:hypothetical protein